MFLNLQTISKNNFNIPKEGQPITAHKQKPKFHRTMPTLFVPSLICKTVDVCRLL
jgi:hypothetical protein